MPIQCARSPAATRPREIRFPTQRWSYTGQLTRSIAGTQSDFDGCQDRAPTEVTGPLRNYSLSTTIPSLTRPITFSPIRFAAAAFLITLALYFGFSQLSTSPSPIRLSTFLTSVLR